MPKLFRTEKTDQTTPKRSPARTVALMGVATALALAFSYIETFIPMFPMLPGAKIGLSNVVTVVLLYGLSPLSALTVGLLKVVLSGVLFSGPVSILYGGAGVLVSMLGMTTLKKIGVFSPVGVSAFGGVLHNVGQLTVAFVILQTDAVLYYLPYLVLCGVFFGVLVGVVARLCLAKMTKGGVL